MKSAPIILLSLILAGCSGLPTEPSNDEVRLPGTVQLQAERTSPSTIRLTLHNDSGSNVGYNLCSSAMERRSGNNWNVVPSDGACTMELRILEPGGTATYTRPIPPGLAAGEYRFVTRIESPVGSRQEPLASNTIRVS